MARAQPPEAPAPASAAPAPETTPAPESALAPESAPGLIVRGRRANAGITRHTLERGELTGVAGTMGDPVRAVLTLPGMGRQPFGWGGLVIRGAWSGNSGAFVDGVPVPQVFHFGFGPAVVAGPMVDRIDYFPGNFPVSYGQLAGGLVDVTLHPGAAESWQGSTQIDLGSAGFFVQGPWGDTTTLSFAARRSYVDKVLGAGLSVVDVKDPPNLVPVFWDYQARLDHYPAAGTHVFALAFGASDRWAFVGKKDQTEAEAYAGHRRFHRVALGFDTRLPNGGSFSIAPYGGMDDAANMADDGSPGWSSFGDTSTMLAGLRSEVKLRLGPTWRLRLGLQGEGRGSGVDIQTLGDDGLVDFGGGTPVVGGAETVHSTEGGWWERKDSVILSSYADATAEYPFGLSVTPGLRFDAYSVEKASTETVDPRLTARQRLSDDVTLKVGLGRFSQLSRSLVRKTDGGEPVLQPASAWHLGLGAEIAADPWNTLALDTYYNRHLGSPRLKSELVLRDGMPYGVWGLSHFQRRAYGLEILLKRAAAARSSGWISYSLSRTESRVNRQAAWRRSDWDATHHLVMVWNVRLPSHWAVGAHLTVVSGYPSDPIVGSYDTVNGRFVATVLPGTPDGKLPLYRELDLRAEKTWPVSFGDVVAYVDLINAGNARNVEFWQYNERLDTGRAIHGMPIYPAFGLQVNYR